MNSLRIWCMSLLVLFILNSLVFCTLTVNKPISDHYFDLSSSKNEYVIPVTTFQSSVGSMIEMSLSNPPDWAEYSLSEPKYLGFLTMNGDANYIYVSGNYAYIAEDAGGLRIIDITRKDQPLFSGNLDTDGAANYVVVDGDYAFIAAGMSGLLVVKIQNKNKPEIVGQCRMNGTAKTVKVIGNYAYVAGMQNGLVIFNVDEKSSPYQVGHFPSPLAERVFVEGNLAYIADEKEGLIIVDVTTKTNPTLVGTYKTPGEPIDIYVSGNYAFIAQYYVGILILDISVPSSPQFVNNATTPGAAGSVLVSGDYMFVGDSFTSGIRIFDISQITSEIPMIASLRTPGDAYNLFLPSSPDGYIYVADGRKGIVIIDLQNITNPTICSVLDTSGDSSKVYVGEGDVVYLADSDGGLKIVDSSDPSRMRLIGSLSTDGTAHDVFVHGSTVYLAGGSAGLQLIDATLPTEPKFIKSVQTGGYTLSVSVKGFTAFVVDVNSGLKIVDVGIAMNASIIGSYDSTGIKDVTIVGTTVYLVGIDLGLVVLDVSTKSNPQKLGNLTIKGSTGAAVVVDEEEKFAYIADSKGMTIMDVSDKSMPKNISTVDVGTSSYDIFVMGNIAYVADRLYSYVAVVDITNRENPVIVSEYNCKGTPEGVFGKGNNLYVAGSFVGLEILRVGDIRVSLSQPPHIFCGNTSLSVSAQEIGTGQVLTTTGLLFCNDICPEVTKMRGTCAESSNSCPCLSPTEYYGLHCDHWYCYGYKYTDSLTCHGFGECVSPNHCKCDEKHYGEECEKLVDSGKHGKSIVGLVIGLSLCFGFSLIVFVICLFGCCLVLVASVAIPLVTVFVAKSSSGNVVLDDEEEMAARHKHLGRPLIDEIMDESYGGEEHSNIQ